MLKTRWIALCALLALLVTVTAEARPRPRESKIEGTIGAVNTAASTVTITRGALSVTLGVNALTKIEVDHQRATLADLAVGDLAEAKFDANTLIATKIEVETDAGVPDPGEAMGRVLDATADAAGAGTVVLDTDNDTVADLTLTTNILTQIKIGGLRIAPEDIELIEGLVVSAKFGPTTFVAREIKADAAATINVTGTVTAVDTANGTLTVQTSTGPVTVVITEDTDLKINGQRVELEDVVVGDPVQVGYVALSNGVNLATRVNILIRRQNVNGTISAVDAVAGTITVATRQGSVVLTLDANTDLRVNGRVVTLAQLVTVLNPSRPAKVSAHYVARGTVNLADQVRVNVQAGGRR